MFFNIISIKDNRIRNNSKNIIFFKKKKLIFLIKNMIKIMYDNEGIGISSNQICYFKKILIVDVSNKRNKPIVMINPEIINCSNFYTLCTEGCLSSKMYWNSIPRPEKILVKFINKNNKIKKKIFSGILSRCLQHEIDHHNGKIITDYSNKIIYNKK